MNSVDSGVNKRFDRILKAFVDEAPNLFLRLLGIIPPGATASLTPLRPETAPAVLMPDFVAALTIEGGEPFIFHVEFYVNYFPAIPSTVARYGGSLAWQHGRRVLSLVVLLHREGVPRAVPRIGHFDIGETKTRHPFRVVRLWKIDAAPILKTGDWRVLPWSVLMKSSDREVRRVATILAREGDEESVARFITLGSLRYDRSQLEEMLGDGKMGLVEAILEGSSLVREVKEKAREEGRTEGRTEGLEQGRTEGLEKGRSAEARRTLRIVLKNRFPGLEGMPEIEAISAAEALESLLEMAITSTERADIERSIAGAVRPN